ncbi:MAG TPA: threonine/serine dehydratase [Longimicrobiales bacterium]
MISLADIQAARAAIAGRVHRTPLLTSRSLSERAGTRVSIKAECLQKTGSFKVRGVFNRLRRLSPEERARGLITISAGNHAQALAYGATREGIPCTVVMPAHASRSKVEASRAYGADIVLHGSVFEAFEKCEQLRREHALTLVHPFNDPDIIAGQGTIGLEILEDAPDTHTVVVPIGGGGLISGIAAAIKALRPATRVIGVEPEGAATMTLALRAGEPARLEHIDTIADGLAAPAAGPNTLEHVRALVDDIVLLTDAEIRNALAFLLERAKLVVEPAGAAAAAALLAGKVRAPADAHVVIVASGGNVDLPRLGEFIA